MLNSLTDNITPMERKGGRRAKSNSGNVKSLFGDVGSALHEAGHAITATELSLPWRLVSVVPDEDSQGRLVFYHMPKLMNRLRRVRTSARERSWWTRRAVAIAGGPVSEKTFGRTNQPESGNVEDYERMTNIALAMHPNHKEARIFLQHVWDEAYSIVTTPRVRKRIEALTNALLATGTVLRTAVPD